MLKITTGFDRERATLELEGWLAGPWVQELRDCWRRAKSADRKINVVLKQVTFIDDAGRQLLAEMHRQGAALAAEGCMTKAIVEAIIGGKNHE
jgi:anti-anti-sigma regulatory factor